ncbi:MAG TPA: DUF2950 domain-containing protein [Terracidiphilus sp.]|nr:DUF2950 domain-containing protein [Terracidiphilus sp.]
MIRGHYADADCTRNRAVRRTKVTRSFHSPALIARRSRAAYFFGAGLVLLVAMVPAASRAQSAGEKTFSSPGDAVLALYNAAKAGDSDGLNAIFGSNAAQILHTGDDVADKNALTKFASQYDQMHRVVAAPDQTVTVYVGPENWPMPIPVVKNSSGAWYFDTQNGLKEILYRRIGNNEDDAIDVLQALIDAQKEYAATTHDGEKTKHYAMKLVSDEGKQDGLYWKTADSDPPSPIGPLLAGASDEGYRRNQGQPTPFHGYIYRLITRQGAAAKGGARDYMANGQLSRGVAFVAYPAGYRNSGVMTFIVNQDGVVYQKDLGPDTAKLAEAMTDYNPDGSWDPAE